MNHLNISVEVVRGAGHGQRGSNSAHNKQRQADL